MEKLTKENFFDELQAKHPLAMAGFYKWIDGYKIRVSWGLMFQPSIKFHDLPFEMQEGVIMKWARELAEDSDEEYSNAIVEHYKEFFADLERVYKSGERFVDYFQKILEAQKEAS